MLLDLVTPSYDEECESHEIESIDTLFFIKKKKWDRNYFDGDPIYNTNDDGFMAKDADFGSYFMMVEQPYFLTDGDDLVIHKGDFCGHRTSEILQLSISPTLSLLIH